MDHIRPRSNIYLLLIVMILVSGIALVAAQETRATRQSNLEGSVLIEEINNNMSAVDSHLLGPFGADGFPQIKATAFPVDNHPLGPSGVDVFAQIKATAFPVDTRLPGPSGVDEVQQIKGNLIP